MKNMNKRRSVPKRIMIVTGIVLLMVIGCAVYIGDYYHGEIENFQPVNAVKISDSGNIAVSTEKPSKGLIFYPGGKVEHTAYLPLMDALASRGISCVLLEMPFHLAVFDMDGAKGIQEQYPEIENWYLGGHSLGGSMAAAYLENCEETYDGLVLMGSYSTADLSGTNLKVLSIYGSEDKVMNYENYEENKKNLPDDFTEVVIEGGCHAYFGMYGAQEGDGTPTISNEEQIEKTADEIAALIGGNTDGK